MAALPETLRDQLERAHGRYGETLSDAELARGEVKALMLRARAEGATNKEIGDVLGVSRQRVSQILRKDVSKDASSD
jgi:DNA-binding MarR family transcriptional regulator